MSVTKIRFIAHAGFYLEHDGFGLALDPWFFSSSFEHPILQGVVPGFSTIDFQVPQGQNLIEEFTPDAVLLSHYHVHHSPLREIVHFAHSLNSKKNQPLLLYGPQLPPGIRADMLSRLHEHSAEAELREFHSLETFQLASFKITSFPHTVEGHLGWVIESPTCRVLHLADARINRNIADRRTDPLWNELLRFAPFDFVFLSSGSHSTVRKGKDGTPVIVEHATMSPLESARLASGLRPRVAAIMGIYNHSVWKNRAEYVLPTGVIEEQFRWAMSHLAPQTTVLELKPGICLSVAPKTDGRSTQIEYILP